MRIMPYECKKKLRSTFNKFNIIVFVIAVVGADSNGDQIFSFKD